MVTRALPPELTNEEWRELGLDPSDPFRYGWRYVAHEQADGRVAHEQIPLTFEDVLHPHKEDFTRPDEEHTTWRNYLYMAFRHLLTHSPMAVVFSNLLFTWDVPGLRGHGPDIAVVFGVRPGNRESFDVSEEGARPALIVEITSPGTANLDRQTKSEHYLLAGIPYYVIIDRQAVQGHRTLYLLGYRHSPAGYEPMIPNERGWLWLEPVRAWLGIIDEKLVCYNEAGEQLRDYNQLVAARSEAQARIVIAEQRTEAAIAAREAAEARLHELEATLRRLQQGQ